MLSSARDGTFSRPPSCENLLATSCWHFCMEWFARIASTPIPFLPLPRAREGGGRQGALPEVRVDLSSRNRSRRVGERERPCPLRLCTAFDDVKQIQNLPIPPKFGAGKMVLEEAIVQTWHRRKHQVPKMSGRWLDARMGVLR